MIKNLQTRLSFKLKVAMVDMDVFLFKEKIMDSKYLTEGLVVKEETSIFVLLVDSKIYMSLEELILKEIQENLAKEKKVLELMEKMFDSLYL